MTTHVVILSCLLHASTTAPADVAPQTDVVVRVSRKLFDDLTRDRIPFDLPVSSSFQGMSVSGQAQGAGVTSVTMEAQAERAQFRVAVTGDAAADYLCDARIATAQASSQVQFSGSKLIHFDGFRFSAGQSQLQTSNTSQVDSICSRHGGCLGKVVRNIAWRQASQSQASMVQFVDNYAQQALQTRFDNLGDQLVEQLNQVTPLDESLLKLYPETANWPARLSSTKQYLQAEFGPPGAAAAQLPASAARSSLDGMELWIRTKPGEGIMASLAFTWNSSHDLLKKILPEDEARRLAKDVKFRTSGGWIYIHIGPQAFVDESKAAAEAPASR